MKLRVSLLLLCSLVLLTGCTLGIQSTKPEPETPTTGIVVETTTPTLTTTGISLTSPAYSLNEITGSNIPLTYSGNDFTLYKITNLSTNKWTYFVIYNGSRSEFSKVRESNMFSGEVMSATGTTLSDISFATLTGADDIAWNHVQVPIDWTLLVHETNNKLYVLDFDDPSGLQNNMSYADIQSLIQYISFIK
ncbi:hypothetical protein XF24_00412 [candidate division SR1 bacterium Aalborg_AAW-1]|nr:hypothetical protein XF24_00412 [candidate division SR1 bacterium Aalborg_AAW-1]